MLLLMAYSFKLAIILVTLFYIAVLCIFSSYFIACVFNILCVLTASTIASFKALNQLSFFKFLVYFR